MEGEEVGTSKSSKRKEPADSRSRKRKESQVSLNELMGSTSESKTTLKRKKRVVDSSLGRDLRLSLPAEGNSEVVLALYCPQVSMETKKVQSRKKLPSSLKHKNLMEKKRDSFDRKTLATSLNSGTSSEVNHRVVDNALCKVVNQELPVSRISDAASKTSSEHEEMCGVQQKKKRTRVGKRRTDQGNKPPSERGRNELFNNLENNHSDQNLMDRNQEVPVNKSLVAASKKVDEREEMCAVQQKKKRTSLGKRRIDQVNRSPLESERNKLSNSLENSHPDNNLMDQNHEVPVNKSFEAALKTTDEHEEVRTVPQKKKRTRVGKRRTDQGNKTPLESGLNSLSNTLENNHSDQNLMGQSQEVPVNKGLGAASKTADGHEKVSVVQQKKNKREGKKPTEQGNKHLLESGRNKLSNTLENNNLEQNLMEERKPASLINHKVNSSTLYKVKEVPVTNSLEAASQTRDKQEVCASQHKRKRTLKSHADQENINLLESGCIRVSDITNTKQLTLENSVQEISELVSTGNEKNKEVLLDNSLIAVQSSSLPDCANTHLPNNHYVSCETELPLVDVKSFKTYQRKDKQFCTLDNNLEPSTDEGWDKPLVNYTNALKKKGRSKKKAETKVAQITHQAKTLESISRYNICDDHLPQENEGDSSRVEKTAHRCELFAEQTTGDSPTDCRKENSLSLLETNDHVGDSYSYNLNLKATSKQGNPSKLCEEGHNTSSQNDKVLSANESSASLPNKISASRKRLRKDKIKHTSHEVNASHDLSTLVPSTEQPNCSFVEGTIECQMEEITPSIGNVKNDAVILGTETREEEECVERSASPEKVPSGHTRRKLLILDLNGLLVDIVSVLPIGYKADKTIARKALLKRPFCDDFLKFCFERFNVGVWSSRTKRNVDSVVDFIMGDMRHKLLFCWDQSHCTNTGFNTVEEEHKPLVLKELKKLWDKHERKGEPQLSWEKREYNESNTLLLDDSPYKALLNPRHTAIFPFSYEFRNANDNSLGPGGDIRTYLERIATAEHVQKYIEQNPFGQRPITSKNPSWDYYLKVINANKFCLPT